MSISAYETAVKELSVTNLKEGIRTTLTLRAKLASLGIVSPAISESIDEIGIDLTGLFLAVAPEETEFFLNLGNEFAPVFEEAATNALAQMAALEASKILDSNNEETK